VGAYDGKMWALESRTGWLRWSIQTGSQISVSPAVLDDHVYVPSYDEFLYCYRSDTGNAELVWQVNCDGCLSCPPIVVEKDDFRAVLAGSLLGSLRAYHPRRGDLLWKFQTEFPLFYSPTSWQDEVIVPLANGSIVGLKIDSGETTWGRKYDQRNCSTPLVYENVLLFGGQKGFTCVDLKTKQQLWQISQGNHCLNYARLSDTKTLLIDTNGHVSCVDLKGHQLPVEMLDKDGKELPTFENLSTPIIHSNYVIVGGRDNLLKCFRRNTTEKTPEVDN